MNFSQQKIKWWNYYSKYHLNGHWHAIDFTNSPMNRGKASFSNLLVEFIVLWWKCNRYCSATWIFRHIHRITSIEFPKLAISRDSWVVFEIVSHESNHMIMLNGRKIIWESLIGRHKTMEHNETDTQTWQPTPRISNAIIAMRSQTHLRIYWIRRVVLCGRLEALKYWCEIVIGPNRSRGSGTTNKVVLALQYRWSPLTSGYPDCFKLENEFHVRQLR